MSRVATASCRRLYFRKIKGHGGYRTYVTTLLFRKITLRSREHSSESDKHADARSCGFGSCRHDAEPGRIHLVLRLIELDDPVAQPPEVKV